MFRFYQWELNWQKPVCYSSTAFLSLDISTALLYHYEINWCYMMSHFELLHVSHFHSHLPFPQSIPISRGMGRFSWKVEKEYVKYMISCSEKSIRLFRLCMDSTYCLFTLAWKYIQRFPACQFSQTNETYCLFYITFLYNNTPVAWQRWHSVLRSLSVSFFKHT